MSSYHGHVDDAKAVGRRLRKARFTAGMSQRDLAFPGCTAVYVCRIERGDRVLSLQVLRELARRLDVAERWLSHGDDAREFTITVDGRTLDENLRRLTRTANGEMGLADLTEDERRRLHAALAAQVEPLVAPVAVAILSERPNP